MIMLPDSCVEALRALREKQSALAEILEKWPNVGDRDTAYQMACQISAARNERDLALKSLLTGLPPEV